MNREELKEKIDEILRDECYTIATTDRVMLLIDQYTESREKVIEPDQVHAFISEMPQGIRATLERNGWTNELMSEEAQTFIEINYPTGGDLFKIRKHFFNYMKKRKPEQGDKATKVNNWFKQ